MPSVTGLPSFKVRAVLHSLPHLGATDFRGFNRNARASAVRMLISAWVGLWLSTASF